MPLKPAPLAGWALATAAASLAAWWFQNRAEEDALVERTRARLRTPAYRGSAR